MPKNILIENVFSPVRVEWLSYHCSLLEPSTKAAVYENLSVAVSRHQTSNVSFLYECLQLLAHLSVKGDVSGSSPFCATNALCLRPAAIAWHEHKAKELESLIRSGGAKANDYRLYADYHTQRHAKASVWETISADTITYDNRALKRLVMIVSKFAKETTFKVHADAGLHAEIITSVMAPFLCSALVQEETPYQIAANVLGPNVNDIVRPLLNTAVRDRIDNVKWDGPYNIASVIVTASILFELVGVLSIRICTNATFCKGRQDIPLLWVNRDPDGNGIAGLRRLDKYYQFSSATTVADILMHWIKEMMPYNVSQVDQLYKVLFTNDIENSPLCKFIR